MALDLAVPRLRRKGHDAHPRHEDAVPHAAFQPRLPAVNLLPARVVEQMRVARLRRRFIAAGALVVVAAAGVWVLQQDSAAQAESTLAASQADNARLQARVSSYAAIRQLNDQISAQEGLVTTALASDPQADGVISRLRSAAGGDVTFTQLAVTYSGIPDPAQVAAGTSHLFPCPDPAPFTEKIAVGCVTFTAQAPTRDAISGFLTRMENDPVLVGANLESSVFVSASDGGNDSVTFTGSVGIGTDGLRTPLTTEAADAIIAASHPKPSASSDAQGSAQTPAATGATP